MQGWFLETSGIYYAKWFVILEFAKVRSVIKVTPNITILRKPKYRKNEALEATYRWITYSERTLLDSKCQHRNKTFIFQLFCFLRVLRCGLVCHRNSLCFGLECLIFSLMFEAIDNLWTDFPAHRIFHNPVSASYCLKEGLHCVTRLQHVDIRGWIAGWEFRLLELGRYEWLSCRDHSFLQAPARRNVIFRREAPFLIQRRLVRNLSVCLFDRPFPFPTIPSWDFVGRFPFQNSFAIVKMIFTDKVTYMRFVRVLTNVLCFAQLTLGKWWSFSCLSWK